MEYRSIRHGCFLQSVRLRARSLLAALAWLLAACGPAPVPAAPSPPALTADVSAIRFGVVGDVWDVNIWALFDKEGAGYANFAVMSAYWPRLYTLSIPDRQFIPLAAEGAPSTILQEGPYYVGTVRLRQGLVWTDHGPFTAQDVAFTINTALAFHLGFDWKAYYDSDALERAEAIDSRTVKFYFKRPPDVGLWQYGVLQGPIVQKAYWEPRIGEAVKLLPEAALAAQIDELGLRLAASQTQVDELKISLNSTPPGTGAYQQADADLRRRQETLNQDAGKLAKLQTEFDGALDAARAALYSSAHEAEPTLGAWMPAGWVDGAWVNAANPDFPFGRPNFEWATYRLFADEEQAMTALENNTVDVLLAADGLSKEIVSQRVEEGPSLVPAHNTSSSTRFIAINPSRPALTDPPFRRVFFCAIARIPLRSSMARQRESFVFPEDGYWQNPSLTGACSALAVRQPVIGFLKASGYTWRKEPTETEAGEGLILPDGAPFPPITLLAPAEGADLQRAELAAYLEQSAHALGIPLTAKLVSADDIRYAVYSSRQYDMAIVGYRLGTYPGYLCDWFGDGNPFGYDAGKLKAACDALQGTSGLEAARSRIFEIESVLAEDLPLIPFYNITINDAYRNVTYPFDSVPGGLSGVYGAPSLAAPSH